MSDIVIEMLPGDGVLRAVLGEVNINVSLAIVTQTVNESAALHELQPASARFFAQGIASGVLLASLQKEKTRLNLQLECDGSLRGMFIDAGSDGTVRGYVKNPYLEIEGAEGAFQWRPLLGNSGYLSVLRELPEGDFYRSSVALEKMELAGDLQRYFETSDQVPTQLAICAIPQNPAEFEAVVGILLQAMPDADLSVLANYGPTLNENLIRAVKEVGCVDPPELLSAILGGAAFEIMNTTAVRHQCTCSKDRVLNALMAMGKKELDSLLVEKGQAVVTCQFCSRKHIASADDIRGLLKQFS